LGGGKVILLDTHALIWWVSNIDKIPSKARQAIRKEVKNGQLGISSISIWEICMLVKKGRIKLTMSLDSWLEMLESLPNLIFIPVDNYIAKTSVSLDAISLKDPADRIIVATALQSGLTLITGDQKIRKSGLVKTLWT
jgi:PIN domain nuclease of toxin-antitoxin system